MTAMGARLLRASPVLWALPTAPPVSQVMWHSPLVVYVLLLLVIYAMLVAASWAMHVCGPREVPLARA